MQTHSQTRTINGLSPGERKTVGDIIDRVSTGNFDGDGLVLEKLKQRNDIFRIRDGDMRLLYRNDNGVVSILALERRRNN